MNFEEKPRKVDASSLISLFFLVQFRRIAISVPDLSVQLDVFDEQRECDESQSLQGPDGINLNSHLDVFYAILRQVSARN
jgi:inverted formin-2